MIDLNLIWRQLLEVDFTPVVLAMVCGGVIGLERELHGRPAGLRTHMMVAICSTMLVLAARTVPALDGSGANVVLDPQRLSAGIVTGIGFLGAAAVVRSGDMVRGLTTGASIWGVAGLGVVIGQGDYGLAVVLTGAALFILVVLDMLPGSLGRVVYRRLQVRGDANSMQPISDAVRAVLARQRIRVQEVSGQLGVVGERNFELSFHVRCRGGVKAPIVLREVAELPGVTRAEWNLPRR